MQPEWKTVNKMTLPYSYGPKDAVGMANSEQDGLPYSNGPKDAAGMTNSEQDGLTIQ